MTDGDVKYDTRDVTAVRGLEARARAKAESEGWEFVAEKSRTPFRTTMTFRRPKTKIPRKAWIIGGAVAAVLVAIIATGTALERANQASTAATTTPRPTVASEATPTTPPTPEPAGEPVTTGPAVTDAEVQAAFQSYFTERAASGVMLGKTVTGVTFANGIVRVTFDPAAAGMSLEDFTALNPFDNLANFAATPVAFNDELGNRLRPVIDSIETVRVDGEPLGTYSRADILALNELEE